MRVKYLLWMLMLLPSCLLYKELPVEYDYSYKGNFKRYRSFDIVKPLRGDSTMINDVIERSIIARMKFLGYRYTDSRPHLMISFKMFYDSLRFTGYIQPEIEEWVKSPTEDLNYDSKKFDLHKGTLLIQFYDRRQNRSIWQGYATSQYENLDFTNDRHLKNAVASILDKYRFWAEGFMENQQQPVNNVP